METFGTRNVLGTKNLRDILSERESIAQDMQVTSFLGPQILIIWTRFSPSCLEPLSNWSRDPREPWTRPRRPGGSRWRGWRWVGHLHYSIINLAKPCHEPEPPGEGREAAGAAAEGDGGGGGGCQGGQG